MQGEELAVVAKRYLRSAVAAKRKVGTPALGLGGSESPSAIRVL